jgi:hypothetical protein
VRSALCLSLFLDTGAQSAFEYRGDGVEMLRVLHVLAPGDELITIQN